MHPIESVQVHIETVEQKEILFKKVTELGYKLKSKPNLIFGGKLVAFGMSSKNLWGITYNFPNKEKVSFEKFLELCNQSPELLPKNKVAEDSNELLKVITNLKQIARSMGMKVNISFYD